MNSIRPVGLRPLPAVRERARVAAPSEPEDPVDEVQEVLREEPQHGASASEGHELVDRRQARTRREAIAMIYRKNALRPSRFKAKI